MESVQLHPRCDSVLLCVLCRDRIDADVVTCAECGARWHRECSANLETCPTLGCGVSLRVRPPSHVRRGWRWIVGDWELQVWVALLAIGTLVGGLLPEGGAVGGRCLVVGLVTGVPLLLRVWNRCSAWALERRAVLTLATVEGWVTRPGNVMRALDYVYRGPDGDVRYGRTAFCPPNLLLRKAPGRQVWVWVDSRDPAHSRWVDEP